MERCCDAAVNTVVHSVGLMSADGLRTLFLVGGCSCKGTVHFLFTSFSYLKCLTTIHRLWVSNRRYVF